MRQFLINKRKSSAAAHLWLGKDTYCRMFSSGGMSKDKSRYDFKESAGDRDVCAMCKPGLYRRPLPSKIVKPSTINVAVVPSASGFLIRCEADDIAGPFKTIKEAWDWFDQNDVVAIKDETRRKRIGQAYAE